MSSDELHDESAENRDDSWGGAPAGRPRGGGGEAGIVLRVILMIAIVLVGVFGMMGLAMLKKEPAEAKISERSLSVDALQVTPEDVPVTVTGLGEVRALNVVPVSPQVPGNVVEVHPRLEMGEVIPAGELLFRIDPRDYRAARDQAAAQVAQLEKTVERLQQQYKIDEARLKTLARNEVLMKGEYDRVKTLFEEDEVGTRSAVDHAEMSLNQTADSRDLLAQAVDLYPVRIQEAQSGLDGARAQLEIAVVNLARTEVRSEFDARVKQVKVEQGQYVNPGMQVMTLADDKLLELSVSLDSRDARNWLQFQEAAAPGGNSWLGELKPVACKIAWTEDPQHHIWEGVVHRIENFDQNTRTFTVAIRVSAEAARSSTGGLPLVEGMFCSVEIPGKVMRQVCRLPRWAVSYEGNVFLSTDNRLTVQAVEVVRTQGEDTFVRGLGAGDTVITTRLINPLPNALLAVEPAPEGVS